MTHLLKWAIWMGVGVQLSAKLLSQVPTGVAHTPRAGRIMLDLPYMKVPGGSNASPKICDFKIRIADISCDHLCRSCYNLCLFASRIICDWRGGGGGKGRGLIIHLTDRYVGSPRACKALSWVMTQR